MRRAPACRCVPAAAMMRAAAETAWLHSFADAREGALEPGHGRPSRRDHSGVGPPALIITRMKAGEDPIPAPIVPAPGPTVAEVAERYLEERVALRRRPAPATQRSHVLRKHILPALGALPLEDATRERVTALHHGLGATPATANVVLTTLSRMFSFAEACGHGAEGGNPCRFVSKYRERRRERFLSDGEFERLGAVLTAMAAEGRMSVHGAATLRWSNVDLEAGELHLAETKTGTSTVTLSSEAVKLLSDLPRVVDTPWLIAGPRLRTRITNLSERWRRVRTWVGLEDVRLHDLRHNWASHALALGESLPMIGRLRGHSKVEKTARYAHLARNSVHEAAARTAASIGADLMGDRADKDAARPEVL